MNEHCQAKSYTGLKDGQKQQSISYPPPPHRSKYLYCNTLNVCFKTSFNKLLLFSLFLFSTSFLIISCDDVADDDDGNSKVPYPAALWKVLTPMLGDVPLNRDILYVSKSGGATTKDGSSWDKAYAASDLKTAIDEAGTSATADKPYLVLVAPGTYTVSATLKMKNNVLIAGGIAEDGSLSSAKTIFDGGGNKQVFANSNLNSSAVLYGVTITKGQVNGEGGGMYNFDSAPNLIRLTFSANKTDTFGGGMFNINSSPILRQVVFSANEAVTNGGGMYNNNGSSPILTQVTFSGNTAVFGGGMYNESSSPILTQVIFSNNTATRGDDAGISGGMSNSNSSPTLTQVTFYGNTADSNGGGMGNFGTSSPTITNSIFWGNTAGTSSNQIYMSGGSLKISNSIVEGAMDAERFILKSGFTGTVTKFGITNTDPTLANTTLELFPGASVNIPTIATTSSAANAGLYVQREGSTLYYSEDASAWYTGFTTDAATSITTFDTTTSGNPPSTAIDLTATDITGHARTGRPDIGAYEAR